MLKLVECESHDSEIKTPAGIKVKISMFFDIMQFHASFGPGIKTSQLFDWMIARSKGGAVEQFNILKRQQRTKYL